ncbi:MerR family transcriptional regulator [Streptomyces sp. 900105755]
MRSPRRCNDCSLTMSTEVMVGVLPTGSALSARAAINASGRVLSRHPPVLNETASFRTGFRLTLRYRNCIVSLVVGATSSPDAAARSAGTEGRWMAVSVALPGLCACRITLATPTSPPRGASPRQLRFYQAKSLITSTREPDNYRDCSEAALGRVQQIRELLNAGLSRQAVRAILPCLQSPRDPIVFEGVTSETVVALERERDSPTERIDILARNRHAIADCLAGSKSARSEPPRAVISPVFEAEGVKRVMCRAGPLGHRFPFDNNAAEREVRWSKSGRRSPVACGP